MLKYKAVIIPQTIKANTLSGEKKTVAKTVAQNGTGARWEGTKKLLFKARSICFTKPFKCWWKNGKPMTKMHAIIDKYHNQNFSPP